MKLRSRRFPIVMMLLVASALSAPLGAADKTASKETRVILVYDRNTELCRPLARFYNHYANVKDSRDGGFIEDRFGSDMHSPLPKFIKSVHPKWLQILHNLDIYNNGDTRDIVINDFGLNWNFITFQSQLIILKPGTEKYEDFGDGEAPKFINPNQSYFELSIDFTNGGSSKFSRGTPYILKHLHYMDDLPTQQKTGNSPGPFPGLGQSVIQRLVRWNGKIFVSAREQGDEARGSMTLVYSVTPAGQIEDVCYLERRDIS